MPKYASDGTQTVASPTDSALHIASDGNVRPKIFDILFGSNTTPADNALQWLIQRLTAVGTATSVTPQPLTSEEPAARATAGENHTAEPTYTSNAIMLNWSMNQRASPRWVAARPGCEMVGPATSASGFGFQPVHSSATPDVTVTAHHEE